MTQPLIEHLLQWVQDLILFIMDIVLPLAHIIM